MGRGTSTSNTYILLPTNICGWLCSILSPVLSEKGFELITYYCSVTASWLPSVHTVYTERYSDMCVVSRQFRENVISRVAQSAKCLPTDWTARVRSPTAAENFSSNLCIQTGSGAHPASCTVGTGGSLSGDKGRPGRDADRSPPSSAEVKKE
jgi:hypothetical protein